MMEPAGTTWPAKTLTPRRLALESRPFLEEPRPFLCAISHASWSVAGSSAGLAAAGFLGAAGFFAAAGLLGASAVASAAGAACSAGFAAAFLAVPIAMSSIVMRER